MNSSTISPIQHITPPPCLVASPLQLQPTITQSTPACLLLPGQIIIKIDVILPEAATVVKQRMLGPPIMQLKTPQLVLRTLGFHRPHSCNGQCLWRCMGPQRTAAPVKQLLLATINGGADDKVVAPGAHIQPAKLLPHAAEISQRKLIYCKKSQTRSKKETRARAYKKPF